MARSAAKVQGNDLKPASIAPRPLILSGRKTVISWSPKSACSHVLVWFFLKEGLLGAANYYHNWPHKFRTEVYNHSAIHKRESRALTLSEGAGYTLIRITRDPIKRMASIFRHVCRYPFMDGEFARKLGIDAKTDGISLADLDRHLDGENLVAPTCINPHLRAQRHPCWDLGFDRVITLNLDEIALNTGLNAIEAELGLKTTRFEKVTKFDRLRNKHYAVDVPFAGPGAIEHYRFRHSETESFPKTDLERSTYLSEMARHHHQTDIDSVVSGDTAGRLFQPVKSEAFARDSS